MENGLGMLGWGVGGIEAEAAMLGQPISMLIPKVVGFRLTGELPSGTTATDLVLTITELLRKHGVVGKFVEFYGDGVAAVPVANRATIGNMSPEFGSTCAIFPIDAATLEYLTLTGRSRRAARPGRGVRQGRRACGTTPSRETAVLRGAHPRPVHRGARRIAGPKRPQDRIELADAKTAFRDALPGLRAGDDLDNGLADTSRPPTRWPRATARGPTHPVQVTLEDGTETTPGPRRRRHRRDHLLHEHLQPVGHDRRRAAGQEGGRAGPEPQALGEDHRWRPGSKVVMDYYERAGLMPYLDKLGFNLVGYGCTTCIGNSGPLPPDDQRRRSTRTTWPSTAVLSGNRNFEGRINPDVKMNYLASPPLVVAYALAGTMDIDLNHEPLGSDPDGKPVYLADIWPSPEEVADVVAARGGARRCSPATTPTCSRATTTGAA